MFRSLYKQKHPAILRGVFVQNRLMLFLNEFLNGSLFIRCYNQRVYA
jgi:hypothetical protein